MVIVFVHGLAGWGGEAAIARVMPYWGGPSGSIPEYLGRQGYECHTASVGPFSSTWDRACDLFAQLAGTRADYGAAHAAAQGHARCGRAYDAPLVPGWANGKRKIHLVGHSFGGATIRLLAHLLEEGSAEEREATPEGELSPLFSGQLGGCIASVTTLAAPHNGSTALEPQVHGAAAMQLLMTCMAQAATAIPLMGRFYPVGLEQFGISFRDSRRALRKTAGAINAFANAADGAKRDLTIDGAAALNKAIRCQPGIYYFSYAAQMTREDGGGNHVPKKCMTPILREVSACMGRRRAPFQTAGGIWIGGDWLPNDGIVNLVSALHPFGDPHQEYDSNNLRPGVWQVMPVVQTRDHATFIAAAGPFGGGPALREFYLSLARMLERTEQTHGASPQKTAAQNRGVSYPAALACGRHDGGGMEEHPPCRGQL